MTSRRWPSRGRGLVAALALLLLAAPAAGDPAGAPLAAPGPCAERRVALGASPQGEAPVPDRGAAEGAASAESEREAGDAGAVSARRTGTGDTGEAGEAAPERDARSGGEDGFDVAGSPRHHFTPGDVAAGGGGDAGAGLPTPPAFTRDACDAPNAGCGSILGGAARAGGGGSGVVESPVQPGLPPGAGR